MTSAMICLLAVTIAALVVTLGAGVARRRVYRDARDLADAEAFSAELRGETAARWVDVPGRDGTTLSAYWATGHTPADLRKLATAGADRADAIEARHAYRGGTPRIQRRQVVSVQRVDRGRGHSYTIDGEKADGVTTLLRDGLAKPALLNWAANTTAAYAVDHWDELALEPPSKRLEALKKSRYADLDQAARRGTEVHALAEKLVQGIEVEVPEALAGHVESYVKFLDEWEPEPILVEAVVASRRWRYCGTLDLVARLAGAVWLLDVKTARSGIFSEVALQLAAYRHAEVYLDRDGAEQSMAELGITRAGAIHVRADGYDVVPLDTSDAVFKDFCHVAWTARMTKRMSGWRGDALRAPSEETA